MFKQGLAQSVLSALLFALIFVGGRAVASPTPVTFGPPLVLTAPGLYFPAVVDLDRDGHLDIVAETTAGFTVFYGNGDGSFTQVDYSIPIGTSYVFGDFTGDGHMDIATALGGQIWIIPNLGNRQFGKPVYTSVGEKIYGLCTGDFNNDGKPDLAAADNGTGDVYVLLNNGTGGFLPAVSYSVGGYLKDIQTADLNNDGNLDLVVGVHYNQTATILFGDGTGKFPKTGTAQAGGGNIALADFNDDGWIDIAGCNYWGSELGLAFNNGSGAFPAATSYSPGSYPSVIYAGDLNGDGYMDLTIGQQGASDFTIWLNDGTGKMIEQGQFTTSGSDVHQPALGDFDEDGLPDVVVDGWTDHLSVYLNTTNPTPTLTLLNPAATVAGGSAVTLNVVGTGFLKRSEVVWNTTPLPTKFVGNTVLQATLPASYLTTAGTDQVTVVTAAPGGGTSSPGTFTVTTGSGTKTTLTSTVNPTVFGQATTFTAKVSPSTATGTVTFASGTALLGTSTVAAGSASLMVSSLAVGTHPVVATYSGGTVFPVSTSPALNQTVARAKSSVTLTLSPSPSTVGSTVTLTATISSVSPGNAAFATDTISFFDGSVLVGTAPIADGVATLTLTDLKAATHTFIARFSGDITSSASTSAPVTQVVTPGMLDLSLATSANPSVYTQKITFTATLDPVPGAPIPSGSIVFTDGGAQIGKATLVDASATFATSALTVQSHSIVASYAGDTNYLPTAPVTVKQVVNVRSTETTLTASLTSPAIGVTESLTATVVPVAPASTSVKITSGSVSFLNGSTVLGTAPIANGSAKLVTNTLPAGTYTITAVYGGDSVSATSLSAPVTVTVNPGPSKTTLAVSTKAPVWGQSVTLSVKVSQTAGSIVPTGSVIVTDGSAVVGTITLTDGVGDLSLNPLSVGTHSVTALYSGDANYLAGTSSPAVLNVTIRASSVVLTSSANPAKAGQTVTITATVAPVSPSTIPIAGGVVILLDNNSYIGLATLVNGIAKIAISKITAGTHNYQAIYGGDSYSNASTSAVLVETVTP